MSNGGPTDIIGQGWKFPVKTNPSGGLDWSSGPDRIRDAIWIILNTSPGERVMLSDIWSWRQGFRVCAEQPRDQSSSGFDDQRCAYDSGSRASRS